MSPQDSTALLRMVLVKERTFKSLKLCSFKDNSPALALLSDLRYRPPPRPLFLATPQSASLRPLIGYCSDYFNPFTFWLLHLSIHSVNLGENIKYFLHICTLHICTGLECGVFWEQAGLYWDNIEKPLQQDRLDKMKGNNKRVGNLY